MNKFTTTAIALLSVSIAVPAFAGSLETPLVEAAPIAAVPYAAPASDWTGAYGGVSLGYGFGEDAADDADDVLYGLHGGYTHDFGNIVIGAELEYFGSEQDNGTVAIDTQANLKLRAGYDLGNFLVYGVAGGSYAEATIGGTSYDDTGFAYGAGVEYAVSDSISTGLEILHSDFEEFDDSGSDLSTTNVAARVSFRF